MLSIIGETRLAGQVFDVIFRATTEVNGPRRTDRMKTSWGNIEREKFISLFHSMLAGISNFDRTQLQNTSANVFFRQNCGRGNRFEFSTANLITSSDHPGKIVIAIEISETIE